MTLYTPPRPPQRIVFFGWILALAVSALLWWALVTFSLWVWSFPLWELGLKVAGGALALCGSGIMFWALYEMERDDRSRRRRRERRDAA